MVRRGGRFGAGVGRPLNILSLSKAQRPVPVPSPGLEIELNWDRPGITKDWSLTSWGESGPVTVIHSEGISSDHLPYTPKKGGRSDVYDKPASYSSVA